MQAVTEYSVTAFFVVADHSYVPDAEEQVKRGNKKRTGRASYRFSVFQEEFSSQLPFQLPPFLPL